MHRHGPLSWRYELPRFTVARRFGVKDSHASMAVEDGAHEEG